MCRLKIHREVMKALQAVRAAPDADAIIISDANSVFINTILQHCGVADVFSAVLTNPASFNNEGLMTVAWHHTHTCQLCAATPNMCKGALSYTSYFVGPRIIILTPLQVPFSENSSRILLTSTLK